MKLVFDLLRDISQNSETDPETRIAELSRRRAAIDAEIEEIRAGHMAFMDPTRLRERFLQATDTARALLADFRQVEQNFRDLDRQVRERIATWEGGKAAILEEVLGQRDAITDSDQGRSFRAFWDFLMSADRQQELTELLESILSLEPVAELNPDPRLRRIHYDWLTAGEATQRTVARLSEQLRRYLDDQAWLENRRIMDLLRGLEQHALAVRENLPTTPFMTVEAPAPTSSWPWIGRCSALPSSHVSSRRRSRREPRTSLPTHCSNRSTWTRSGCGPGYARRCRPSARSAWRRCCSGIHWNRDWRSW